MEIMKNQSIVIGQVEDFIQRIHDGDLVIMPKAQKIIITDDVGKEDTFGRRKKEPHSLAILLGSAMSHYQSVKDITVSRSMLKSNPTIRVKLNSQRTDIADHVQRYIDLAYTYGVIKDLNLTNKLKDCQEQNQRLKEKVDKLGKENQRLHETLKNFGKAGLVSDVTDEREDHP